jgi:hypothetical protein
VFVSLHRKRFKEGARYARLQMLDPIARAEYEALSKRYELTGAFAAAVGDYLKAPVVSAINTSKYTGKVNDVIAISARSRHSFKKNCPYYCNPARLVKFPGL